MKKLCILLIALAMLLCISAQAADNETTVTETYTGGQLKSSRSLAAGYIHDLMFGTVRRGTTASEHLFGTSKMIYDVLRPEIIKIAAGERSDTVFEMDVDALYGNQEFYSSTLLSEQVNSDVCSAIDALLLDMPYELYWYDKTAGVSFPYSYSTGTLCYLKSLTLKLNVAATYQLNGEQYAYNTSYGKAAKAAATNAQNIVSTNAGKSDRDKLTAYKNTICDMVSYNHAAAGGGVAYGDPWQVIWVFDGNGTTNVVCEGYSKAFQYLCDLSSFQSGKVKALCVMGLMQGGTGAGRHMWNVVTLPNGYHYLVDVTNCDEGSVGYPDALFLAMYTSGNFESGYIYDANGVNIKYVYETEDTDLAGLLGTDNLLMINDDGEQPETEPAGTPTPTPSFTPTTAPTKTPAPTKTAAPTVTPTTAPTTVPVSPTAAPDVPTAAPAVPTEEPEEPEEEDELFTDLTGRYRIDGSTAVYDSPAAAAETIVIPAMINVNGIDYKVTAIEAYAFESCHWLKTVSIGKYVKTIGESAFENCTALKAVKGGAGVVTIGKYAFYKCKALTKLPSFAKLKTIGTSAFQNCTKLTSVTLSKNVKTIGAKAFYKCAKLKKIVIKTTKLTSSSVKGSAFKGIYKKATVKVPAKKLKAYRTLLVKRGVPKTARIKK